MVKGPLIIENRKGIQCLLATAVCVYYSYINGATPFQALQKCLHSPILIQTLAPLDKAVPNVYKPYSANKLKPAGSGFCVLIARGIELPASTTEARSASSTPYCWRLRRRRLPRMYWYCQRIAWMHAGRERDGPVTQRSRQLRLREQSRCVRSRLCRRLR